MGLLLHRPLEAVQEGVDHHIGADEPELAEEALSPLSGRAHESASSHVFIRRRILDSSTIEVPAGNTANVSTFPRSHTLAEVTLNVKIAAGPTRDNCLSGGDQKRVPHLYSLARHTERPYVTR